MIMCGSTPRALSWGGTLAVLTLGLFALPLLPTFARAQAPAKPIEIQVEGLRFQPDKGPEGAKAQAELEKAHAELAKLQQAMKATQDRIRALEAQLATEKGIRGAQQPQEGIEIILRKVGDKWEIVQPPAVAKRVILWRAEEKDGGIRVVPVEPVKPIHVNPPAVEVKPGMSPPMGTPMPGQYYVPRTPTPNYQPMPKPGMPPQDSRIDNLERQLQQIMKELESLRKEMKQPGKTGAAPEDDPRRKRLDELKKGLPPGAKIEEKDGIQIITLPVEPAPLKKPGDPFEIAPKR